MRQREFNKGLGVGLHVLAGLWLLLALAACTVQQSQATLSQRQTEMAQSEVAATLTAWPTPPPLVTLPATLTPPPQPVWTAVARSTASAPAPTPSPSAYLGATALATGPGTCPVRLLIPSLGLDLPIVEVSWTVLLDNGQWRTEWQTANAAVGYHTGSANPGEAGNLVLSGHHNTRGEVFRLVSEIGQPGVDFGIGDDVVVVADDGQRYTYTVVDWDRFLEEGTSEEEIQQHAQYLAPTQDATLTLVTCWPYESNTHRVVVIAKLKP